jgi:hypothetical protein
MPTTVARAEGLADWVGPALAGLRERVHAAGPGPGSRESLRVLHNHTGAVATPSTTKQRTTEQSRMVILSLAQGLEKYVLSKVWRQTFGVGQEDRDRDERYARLMRALSFVDLPTLMGVEGVAPDPALLAMAQGELLKMDKYKVRATARGR